MTSRIHRHRLDRVERQVAMTPEQQQFERNKRFCYHSVDCPILALILQVRVLLGETEAPDWLKELLEQPLPADLSKSAMTRIEREAMAMAASCLNPDELDKGIDRIIENYSRMAGRPLRTLLGVQEYLESAEKERCRNVAQ